MKRFLSILMIALMFAIGFGSCNSCNNNGSKTEEPAQLEMVDTVSVELNVEHLTALDRQAMYMNAGEDYRWFETGVVLNNWLDEDNDGSIEMVVNVFQSVIEFENGADTWVYKFQHNAEGTYTEKIHGFWVEDLPLNEEAITVTFEQAYERVMEVNLPKPHTRQVVLRKQLGPKDCNPQWIFGNARAQIYVDAVTGEVTSENPAFNGLNLGTPLGEWP